MWDVDLLTLKVGDKVMARKPIYEGSDEYSPGGYLCQAFELLIVRKVGQGLLPIGVSHPEVADNSFGVKPEEIAMFTEAA